MLQHQAEVGGINRAKFTFNIHDTTASSQSQTRKSGGLTLRADLRIFAAMNLRYRIRLARQVLWRKRRILWRTFEALIALFCLLATHQAVWVYFKDLSFKLRLEFPNPDVWLMPTKVAADRLDATQAVTEVHRSPIDFQGYAPPGREVILKVNEVERGRQWSPHGQPTFYDVPLRRGKNTVRGVLREDQSPASALPLGEQGQQIIYYRPSALLATKILSATRNREGEVLILGMADPTANLRASFSASAGDYPLYSDNYGIFQERVFASSQEQMKLRVWAEAEKTLSDSLVLSDSLLDAAPQVKLSRNITLVLAEKNYKLHGRATLIPGSAWEEWISQKLVSPEDLLVDYFGFGLSCFNPWMPRFAETVANIEVASDTVRLTVTGKIPPQGLAALFTSSTLLNNPPVLFREDETRLEIYEPLRLRRVARPEYNHAAFTGNGHVYVWKSAQRFAYGNETLFELEPLPAERSGQASADSSQRAAAPKRKTAPRYTIVQQIQDLEDLVPRKVRDILTALLITAPFLWLLIILRASHQQHHRDYRATLHAATMAFFLFHFILLSFPVFSTSFRFIDPVLLLFEASPAVLATVKDLGDIYPFLTIGIIFLFRPLYYTYRRRLPPPTLGRRVQRQFVRWLVFWPAVIILPALLFYGLVQVREAAASTAAGAPTFENYLVTAAFFGGLGLLCCWIFLYWLLAVGLGQPIRVRTAIIVSWAMLLLPLFPILVEAAARFVRYVSVKDWGLYPFFIPPRQDNTIWFLLIVGVGTALFYQFVELSLRLSQSRRGFAFLRSKWIWALLPVFILLSLPMKYVFASAETGAIDIVALNELARGIASLLPAALLIGLITYLRQSNPQDQFELRAEAISVGTILFAYYLTGRNTSLLFAPVLLFLGWAVFTRWALVERVLVPPPTSAFALQDLVRKLLDYKQARQLSASLRRNLEKKYSQGELSLADLHGKLKDGQDQVEKTKAALSQNEAEAKEKIFGHGPELGPWANAKTALRYGLALSLPFQASTFLNVINRQHFENFPLLQVANSLVFSLTNWLLIAFVFGYFFHKIRGRDGFAKAFVFAGALLVSTIPLRILDARPLLDQAFVVQIVQILAYVLLLALIAFDLRTLQTLGFTWRDLLTVHGFTTITAYGSSIALATLASLSGQQWFSFVGKFVNLLLGANSP
jgi:hypothetical protein